MPTHAEHELLPGADGDCQTCLREIAAAARPSVEQFPKDPILWPQPDGTTRVIGADDIRALVGYIDQRDGS